MLQSDVVYSASCRMGVGGEGGSLSGPEADVGLVLVIFLLTRFGVLSGSPVTLSAWQVHCSFAWVTCNQDSVIQVHLAVETTNKKLKWFRTSAYLLSVMATRPGPCFWHRGAPLLASCSFENYCIGTARNPSYSLSGCWVGWVQTPCLGLGIIHYLVRPLCIRSFFAVHMASITGTFQSLRCSYVNGKLQSSLAIWHMPS